MKKRRGSGKSRSWSEKYMWVFLGMIVIFLAIVAYPGAIGLDPSVGTTLTQLFPTLFLTAISIYMLTHAEAAGKFGGTMCLGLALCLFIGAMDTRGLVTVSMVSGLTLTELQVWIMAISTIIGAVYFASQTR